MLSYCVRSSMHRQPVVDAGAAHEAAVDDLHRPVVLKLPPGRSCARPGRDEREVLLQDLKDREPVVPPLVEHRFSSASASAASPALT
jgi:hypothetical protein